MVWELPYGKGRRWSSSGNPVLTGVLGGWRVTGINTITAGQPVNISYGPPTAFQVSTLAPTYRPNYVGGSLYSAERSPANYFNKPAFSAQHGDA